jgi:hypothetical protein
MVLLPWGARTRAWNRGAVLAASALVIALASRLARAQSEEAPPQDVEDAGVEAGPEAASPEPADGGSEAAATPELAEKKKPSDIDTHVSLEIGGYQDSNATTVLTPSISARIENPIAGWGVNGRYLVDVVSAASPDIVATASPRWVEIRNAGNIGGRYKPGNYGIGAGVVTSYTPDYLALGANVQLVQDFDDKLLTVTEGYSYGHDVIGRVGTPFSIFSRQLDYHHLSAGISRVVNASLVVGLNGDFILERGDQSKPYRYIPIFSPAVAQGVPAGASVDFVSSLRLQARPLEQLPLERDRFALSARLAWRLSSSTIRIEERGYADSWGLRASTTDGRWLFDIGDRLIVWPHVRFHVQNSVDFWQRTYTAPNVHDLPALRTGDRELGALTNIGLGGGLRYSFGKRGKLDDIALTGSADVTRTGFSDTLYVKERWSILLVSAVEVAF